MKINRIAEAMVRQGKSPAHLSQKMWVRHKTIERWARNETQPNLYELVRIAEILDVCVTELLEPTKQKNEQTTTTPQNRR